MIEFNIGSPSQKTSHVERIDPGPYVGIVKGYGDTTGMNRIAVFIDALQSDRLSSETSSQKQEKLENTILCKLMLPYYGRTNRTGNNPKSYEGTSKSYGMWFPTPDIDSLVMVIFAEGDISEGFIIGGIPEPYMLHMVPGIPVSPVFHPSASTTKAGIFSVTAGGTSQLPVAEFNRGVHEPRPDFYNIPKPVHPLTDVLIGQGLQGDYIRGLSTSGAQRESPSNVFGVSTPGPLDITGPKVKQGLVTPRDEAYEWPASRESGHTFVMDDGDTAGKNRNIRLRTGTGHQLLLNDTDGIIYLGNASGTTWVEMTNDGQIDIFSKQNISVHTEGNMDFLADKNINIQSGEDINIMAGHDITLETNHHAVSGKGNLKFFVNGDMQMTSTGHMNFHTDKEFRQNAKEDISYTTLKTIRVNSGGGSTKPIKLNTEAGTDADKAPGLMWAGVPHDSEDKLNKAPWITLDNAPRTGTNTYIENKDYEYRIIMDRVPMHEPAVRKYTEENAPSSSSTPHITKKP